MTLVAEKDRVTIRDVLARGLASRVELLLFTRSLAEHSPLDLSSADRAEALSGAESQELLADLVALSDGQLSLTVHDVVADPDVATRYNVSNLPTVVLRRANGGDDSAVAPSEAERGNVRFSGWPGGYEFSVLIADAVDLSGARTDLSPATREVLRTIRSRVHLQVFVTPT